MAKSAKHLDARGLAKSTARIALIDADSVLYAVALSAEAVSKGTGEHGDDEYLQVKDGEQCYNEVVRKLETLVEAVGASDAIICLTPSGVTQFRSMLLPTYKMNRTARRPEFLKPLQWLIQERKPFGCLGVWGLEADDVCGISATNLRGAGLREPIIVSIDKDMKSVPGLVYSWLRKEEGIVEVSEAHADRAHLYQTLIGDSVDNYTGLPGIGPKKANAILDSLEGAREWSKWEWIVGLYAKKGLDEEYALTQARVARILRAGDWNDKTKEVRLWLPQKDNLQTVPSTSSLYAPAIRAAPSEQSAISLAVMRLSDVLPKEGETRH